MVDLDNFNKDDLKKDASQQTVLKQASQDKNCVTAANQKDLAPTKRPNNWELMRIAENQDCEAYEASDFEEMSHSSKQNYRDFYDDVKQPSDYIKEDW